MHQLRRARPSSVLLRLVMSIVLAAAMIGAVDLRAAVPPMAWAAGYVVNDLTDPGDGTCDGSCTLRDAILAANASAGADTITFSTSGTILLGAALPGISEDLTIDGSGQTVAVDGANTYRVFNATAPLTLTVLTVQRGFADDNYGGGAIFGSRGTLTTVIFISNTADLGGAGAYFAADAVLTGATFINNLALGTHGGGAYIAGAAAITGTTFLSNTAGGKGGGAYLVSATAVTNTNYISNTAGNSGGGAYYVGVATVGGSTFMSNTVGSSGGGGAYFAAAAVVTGTTFTHNRADSFNGGGAYFAASAAVTGTTFISNTTNNYGGGAYFESLGTLADTSFIDNWAEDYGGGVYAFGPVGITGTIFLSNTANSAGGAYFDDTAALTGTTFIRNTAASVGGGALFAGDNSEVQGCLFEANVAGKWGGGLYLFSALNVHLTANRIQLNQASDDGGGVYVTVGVEADLDNNLIVANTVISPTGAAAISLGGPTASLTGRHNTLASATPGSGVAVRAGANYLGQTLAFTNTIFAGYAIGVLAGPMTPTVTLDGVLWSGVTTPTQGALITVTNAYSGAAAFVDAGAGDYHLAGPSAARDVGVVTSLNVDFEGDPRPVGAAPDLGADEYLAKLFLPLAIR
jgi:CSLREA domain-containing protein